jgi:hypothetical protein
MWATAIGWPCTIRTPGNSTLPIGARLGKVIVTPAGTRNTYAEYQTTLIFKAYPEPAVQDSVRLSRIPFL